MNYIFLAIIIGEIAFWVFLLAGLLLRYKWGVKNVSLIFLALTPIIDVFILVFTFIDLYNGTKPHFFHGMSAAYIGFSLIYGPGTIRRVDKWAAYKWSNGTRPVKTILKGNAEIKYQWKQFYRFVICMAIVSGLISLAFLIVPFKETFWFIYWLINNIGLVFIWLLVGPIRITNKYKQSSISKN